MTRVQARIQRIILHQEEILKECHRFDDTLTTADLLRIADPKIYNNRFFSDLKNIFYTLLNFRCFYIPSKDKWVLLKSKGSEIEPVFLENWQVKEFLSFLFQRLIKDRYSDDNLERVFSSLKRG